MADPMDMKFDKRILLRNVDSGVVTQDEVNKHIEGLPDAESNAEAISFEASEASESAAPAEAASDAPNADPNSTPAAAEPASASLNGQGDPELLP